jgi:hypothetical protein
MEEDIHIDCTKDDLNMLITSAVRYALGRETYIVDWTCELVRKYMDHLTENTLETIVRDIQREKERDNLGMDCDKDDWKDLQYEIIYGAGISPKQLN